MEIYNLMSATPATLASHMYPITNSLAISAKSLLSVRWHRKLENTMTTRSTLDHGSHGTIVEFLHRKNGPHKKAHTRKKKSRASPPYEPLCPLPFKCATFPLHNPTHDQLIEGNHHVVHRRQATWREHGALGDGGRGGDCGDVCARCASG
jgi:hypothetical protein